MAVLYTPHFVSFFDDNGDPLSGGKLYTYEAGTTTPKATYTTAAGTIENANPVVLDASGRAIVFIDGSYRFDLYTSAGVLVKSTDNVTNFTTTGDEADAFYQSFSGDSTTKVFTLSEDLGTDEKIIMCFANFEYTLNGTFATDTDWTKGAGWTIGSGVATATGAISTDLEQDAAKALVENAAYVLEYTITRSAGSITPTIGGTAGTARSSSGTFRETIIAGTTQKITFTTSGFTGTLDNVSLTKTGEDGIVPITGYTLNGTSLTFNVSPATGSNNIQVWAPSRLAGAASAAASDAATSASAAATSAATAAAAQSALSATTSTTSNTIGTGAKTFTVAAGKGWVAGQFVLITSDADEANYMHGQITSYSSTTLIVDVTNIGGSGTLADWTITLSGTRGAQGPGGTGVYVSANDTTSGFLNGKLVAGSNITLTENNDGGNETLTIAATVPTTYSTITAASAAGINLQTNGASDVLLLGAGGSINATLYGNLSMNTANKIVNCADPSSAQDVATKAYTDTKSTATVGATFATTSGTTVDITGMPAAAKIITINFVGVSSSGTNYKWIQMGDSGGFETTGYISASSEISTSPPTEQETAAFTIRSNNAADTLHGSLTLTLVDATTNTWALSGVLANGTSGRTYTAAGTKALSGTLTSIRLTTEGGTDTFDAGLINAVVQT